MNRLLVFDEGMFCPQCYILQPIYQRCVNCGHIFELHCGRGYCFRYNPDRCPLSENGLCRRCLNQFDQPGPSNPPPPPPPPTPPPPPGGGRDSGHQNYPSTSGLQRQPPHHGHCEQTQRSFREERSQGRSFSSQTFDDNDQVFKETGTLGYGTAGDFESGWWCSVDKKEEDEKETILELSPMKPPTKKSVKSPTKKSKKSQPSENDSDDGESSDDGVIRKHKIRTTPEK